MRPSTLRALLLVLAMAFQTVAAGWSVARAAPGNARPPTSAEVSAHCAHMLALAGVKRQGAPASESGDHGMCQSCLLCDGPPTVSLPAVSHVAAAARVCASVRQRPVETRPDFAPLAFARRARGPPTLGFRA